MAKHDENRDLRSIAKIGNVSYGNKSITLSRSKTIGIKMWGKLDFLRHYCGWIVLWDNHALVDSYVGDDKSVTTKEKIKKHNKMR